MTIATFGWMGLSFFFLWKSTQLAGEIAGSDTLQKLNRRLTYYYIPAFLPAVLWFIPESLLHSLFGREFMIMTLIGGVSAVSTYNQLVLYAAEKEVVKWKQIRLQFWKWFFGPAFALVSTVMFVFTCADLWEGRQAKLDSGVIHANQMPPGQIFVRHQIFSRDEISERVKIIEWLVHNGANIDNELDSTSTLIYAMNELNSNELVDFLITHGANPNRVLKTKQGAILPLEAAFKMGDLHWAQALLNAHANPLLKSNEQLPLAYYASFALSVTPLKAAQSIAKATDLDQLDHYGANALFYAVAKFASGGNGKPIVLEARDPAIATYLLDQGAHPNFALGEQYHHATPTHIAATKVSPDTLHTFYSKGAEVDLTDANGLTPFAYALYANQSANAQFFAMHGANLELNSLAHQKLTPELYAKLTHEFQRFQNDWRARQPASVPLYTEPPTPGILTVPAPVTPAQLESEIHH